jgi:hypothetical protein
MQSRRTFLQRSAIIAVGASIAGTAKGREQADVTGGQVVDVEAFAGSRKMHDRRTCFRNSARLEEIK